MVPGNPPDRDRSKPNPIWQRSQERRRLVQILRDNPGARLPAHLTKAQRRDVECEATSKRWPRVTYSDCWAAMERAENDLLPRAVAPVCDSPTQDFALAWRQPEGRAFHQRVMANAGGVRSSIAS